MAFFHSDKQFQRIFHFCGRFCSPGAVLGARAIYFSLPGAPRPHVPLRFWESAFSGANGIVLTVRVIYFSLLGAPWPRMPLRFGFAEIPGAKNACTTLGRIPLLGAGRSQGQIAPVRPWREYPCWVPVAPRCKIRLCAPNENSFVGCRLVPGAKYACVPVGFWESAFSGANGIVLTVRVIYFSLLGAPWPRMPLRFGSAEIPGAKNPRTTLTIIPLLDAGRSQVQIAPVCP